jgi:HEAT repeat protein
VALVALALVAYRVYLDGPEAHWLLLKLRYGNVETRRSAVLQVREFEVNDFAETIFSSFESPQTSSTRFRLQQRRAELLLPALDRLVGDPDAECRANAVRALRVLAGLHPSEVDKSQALRKILAATRDRDDTVRMAALNSLSGLADRDIGAVRKAIRSAMDDPSIEVRQAAAHELGFIGVSIPETQAEATSILIPLLASREDSRVRVNAARSMGLFGVDHRRHPPVNGPDVVPGLVAALRDPEVDVRRTVAMLLGLTTMDARGRTISSWDQRKDSIIPALKTSMVDEDVAVRVESALALFVMGQRDAAIIELIEQGVHHPDRTRRFRSVSALKEWQDEQGADDPVEPAASAATDAP